MKRKRAIEMIKMQRINRIFRIEAGLWIVAGIFLYLFRLPGAYLNSLSGLLFVIIGSGLAILMTFSFFENVRNSKPEKVAEIDIKVMVNISYMYILIFLVSDALNVLFRKMAVAPFFLFYLGTFLILLLALPGYFRLVLMEANLVMRMFSMVIFFLLTISVPNTFQFGIFHVPEYAMLRLIAFFWSVFLLIIAMHYWGYRFPRFKINQAVNYWWLALLVFPRLIFIGFSARSWSRLLSLPFTIRLSIPSTIGIRLTIANIIFITVTVCFKEELIFRFLFLNQIVDHIKGNSHVRILKSVLITSVLFAIWHARHFGVYPTPSVLLQMFSAFGIGMIFSVICLYTGTIWITVILHSLFDLLLVDATSVQSPFTVSPNSFGVEFVVLTTTIQIIVAVLAIYLTKPGPFEQTIRENRLGSKPRLMTSLSLGK